MSTIVTRAGKGSALTHTEVDANFTNLNTDKLQSGNTAASLAITSATINGGSINGTTVGATTPAAGTFTSLSDSGNLAFTGTGNRITGDFSNATIANRVIFQTSTVNGQTSIGVIPNGIGLQSQHSLYNASDVNNAALFDLVVNSTEARLRSLAVGTGASLPMTFHTGGSERMRVDTSGNVGIGTSSPSSKLDIVGSNVLVKSNASSGYGAFYANGATGSAAYYFFAINGTETARLISDANNYLAFATGNSGTERMRIDASGNVGIGTSSPGAGSGLTTRLDVVTASGTATRIGLAQAGVNSAGVVIPASVGGLAFEVGAAERMRIDSSGNVLVTSAAGLGYGSGAGGTVTQATSKSTAVTLNKPTGKITMNAAALAAGATVAFTVNNSIVAAVDVPVVISTNGNYSARAYGTGSGSFVISLKNESGVSLSDAVIINFAIIKGATA